MSCGNAGGGAAKAAGGGGGFGEQEPITQEQRQAQEEQARQAYEAEQKRLEEERKKQEEQKPTKAKLIENMNEAQIDEEIERQREIIQRAERTMQGNDITQTADAKAWREAFPLGAGGSGWSQSRINQRYQQMERDSRMAGRFNEAYKAREAAQARLEALEKAKRQVSGTGKTQRQLNEERIKAAENAPKSQTWKPSKRGSTRVYTSSKGHEITHAPGGFFILRAGGREYFFDKLKQAQAASERLK